MARWLAVVLVVACGRSSEPAQVTLSAPPSAPVVHASATALPVATSAPRFTVIGGDVVDLERMSVTRTLTSGELVLAHAITADTTYVWVHGDVRAFDAATGAAHLRWSKPESECRGLAATNAGAYCATGGGARFFRSSNGDAAIVGAAAPATQVVTMGPRVVVLYSDAKVVALDANAIAGTTTLPAMPDYGYGAGPLEVSGDRACGAQRSDTSTKVFCFDASPRLLWSKVSPVAGGLLRQVGDAIVVASDTWSHAPSSEVLRASDGATLLSVPSVRLGAALTTRGVLDGALASEPKLTFYDAAGAVKWTSTAPQHRSESIRAKRFGANVVVAFYSPIATGTQLDAFDLAAGTLAWQADVESLPISHSKYSNRVDLDVRARDVLLLGRESSQEYAESFDGVTGKRLASILRGR